LIQHTLREYLSAEWKILGSEWLRTRKILHNRKTQLTRHKPDLSLHPTRSRRGPQR
jgi:hypothetical protein